MTRRSPRPPAWLVVGALALAACSSSDGPSKAGSSSPPTLTHHTDLVQARDVGWRSWRAVDERTLELTVTAGTPECYGVDPSVRETGDAVLVRLRVGIRSDRADRDCPDLAVESLVRITLDRPLGSRRVEPLP